MSLLCLEWPHAAECEEVLNHPPSGLYFLLPFNASKGLNAGMLLGNLHPDVQSLCCSCIFLISLCARCSVLLYSHLRLQLELFDPLFLTLNSFFDKAH